MFSHVSALLTLFCILISIVLYWVMRTNSGSGTTKKIVDGYEKRNDLLSMYLLSYVFVFAGLMFSNPVDIAVFTTFFAMLAILQIRSEILHINPMLGLAGYHSYQVTSSSRTILVISKGHIEEKMNFPEEDPESDNDNSHTKIKLVPLGGTTYLAP